jgi:hypothetical protein
MGKAPSRNALRQRAYRKRRIVTRQVTATPSPAVTAPVTPVTRNAVAASLAVIDVAAYTAALALASAAAFFSIKGMVVLFPGAPVAVVAMSTTMEAAKLVSAGWLARRWRTTAAVWRVTLVALVAGLAVINATGVYAQLVVAHFGDRMAATRAIQTKATTIAVRIDAQTHALADVDTQLAQIDGAIEEMTKRGRANGALDAINSQRKARAELVAQRQRKADVLADLKTEQAAAAAKAHQVEVEAAPIVYVAQLLGSTTEQALRWLILAMVLCCDPLAIALTAAASARH